MSILATSSATNPYMPGSDAESTAVGATTAGFERQNGGNTASSSQGPQTASDNLPAKIRMYANEHMTATQIAQRLGMSVTGVLQEASDAGIKLDTGNASAIAGKNPALGNNIDVTA